MTLLAALLGCATLAPVGPSPVQAAFALQADRARPSEADVTYGLPGADAEVAGLKSRVDSAKNELYAQNDTTADFDAIGSAASGKAQQLSKANFSPLGNVFAQFARSPSQTASAGGGFGYSSFGGGAANSAASTSVSPASPASSYVVR